VHHAYFHFKACIGDLRKAAVADRALLKNKLCILDNYMTLLESIDYIICWIKMAVVLYRPYNRLSFNLSLGPKQVVYFPRIKFSANANAVFIDKQGHKFYRINFLA